MVAVTFWSVLVVSWCWWLVCCSLVVGCFFGVGFGGVRCCLVFSVVWEVDGVVVWRNGGLQKQIGNFWLLKVI